MSLKWENLKLNKCPRCSQNFKDFSDPKTIGCRNCKFRISLEKFEKIVNKQVVGRRNWSDPDVEMDPDYKDFNE